MSQSDLIFERLELEDFRQYHGKHEIDFSTDRDKHLTLVHAENSVGKTTMLNAMKFCFYGETPEFDEKKELVVSEKLKQLNIELPKAPDPVGSYVAFKKIGNLLYISGQLPIGADSKIIKGKIGKDLTLEDGQKSSKLCVINILAQANKAMDGDLNKIKNCIKITGFVNSTDDFTDQPKVINPASETLSAVFGNEGKHARAAISANSLPLGAAVEIDAIFEVD